MERTVERIHKTAEVWKHLRPPIAKWAKARGFKRRTSSPPAYVRELSSGHVTLFAVGSRGGVDTQAVGGTFTVALQIGEASMPGVDHSTELDLRTTRLPELFSSSEQEHALTIHNEVVQKRRKPTSSHYLNDIYSAEQIEENFFRPLTQLPSPDYWFAFVDEADIHRWSEFLAKNMQGWLETTMREAEGRFGTLES